MNTHITPLRSCRPSLPSISIDVRHYKEHSPHNTDVSPRYTGHIPHHERYPEDNCSDYPWEKHNKNVLASNSVPGTYKKYSTGRYCKTRSLENIDTENQDIVSMLKVVMGLDHTDTVQELLEQIQQLQSRVCNQRNRSDLSTTEVESLQVRIRKATDDICYLREENEELGRRNRTLENSLQLHKVKKKIKFEDEQTPQLNTSLVESHSGVSGVSGASDVTLSQSLRSVSWDSTGCKEEDVEIVEDTKYLKQKVQILERLLKEASSLHTNSDLILHSMTYNNADGRVSLSEFESVNKDNEKLKSKCDKLQAQIEEQGDLINILKPTVSKLRSNIKALTMEKEELSQQLSNSKHVSKTGLSDSFLEDERRLTQQRLNTLQHQMSEEEKLISDSIPSNEKDMMIEELLSKEEQFEETIANLAEEHRKHQEGLVEYEQMLKVCEEAREKAEEKYETLFAKYETMTTYYDSKLFEKDTDIQELNNQIQTQGEQMSNLSKILRNTIGTGQKATTEQVANFRRVSTIRGASPLPRNFNIDKDQLIKQLTNELQITKQKLEEQNDNLRQLEQAVQKQVQHYEQQNEQLEREAKQAKSDLEYFQISLQDRDTVAQLAHDLNLEVSASHTHRGSDAELKFDLENKNKQYLDRIRFLEGELEHLEGENKSLDIKFKKEETVKKELSTAEARYRDLKGDIDYIVDEYINKTRHNTEQIRFDDDNLTAIMSAYFSEQVELNTLKQDHWKLKEDVANRADDPLLIQSLQKSVDYEKSKSQDMYQTLIRYRCDFESQEGIIKENQAKISDLGSENEKLTKDTTLQSDQIVVLEKKCSDLHDELQHKVNADADETNLKNRAQMRVGELNGILGFRMKKIQRLEKELKQTKVDMGDKVGEAKLLKEKLEQAQEKVNGMQRASRRVSQIMNPGNAGQDIESIAMKFKKSYVEELEKNKNLREDVVNKKARIKELEYENEDLQYKVRSAEDELQNTFGSLDAAREDTMLKPPNNNIQCHSPIMMLGDLQELDPLQRFSVDYTDQTSDAMYSEYLEQLQEDLDKERTYSEVVEQKNEQLLFKVNELEEMVQALMNNSNETYYNNRLSTIQESAEEGLYSGDLTEEDLRTIIAKLEELQEELDKERVYVSVLEEKNESLLISLNKTSQDSEEEISEDVSDDEKDEIMQRYLSVKTKLEEREKELQKAQEDIDELRSKLEKYHSELDRVEDMKTKLDKCQKDYDNVSDQLETSLIDTTECEVQVKILEEDMIRISDECKVLRIEKDQNFSILLEAKEKISCLEKEKNESVKRTEELNNTIVKLKDEVDTINEISEQIKSELEKIKCENETSSEIRISDITELQNHINNRESLIAELTTSLEDIKRKNDELEETVENEKLMNSKNRDVMTIMQKEVREAKEGKDKAQTSQFESAGKLKVYQSQFDEKMKNEEVMNKKNREVMNTMQAEVRAAKSERLKARKAMVEAEDKVKLLETTLQTKSLENQQLAKELEIMQETKDATDLKTSIETLNDLMNQMEDREADLLESVETEVKRSNATKEEIARLMLICEEKDEMVLTLESLLKEEMNKSEELEEKLKNSVSKPICVESTQTEIVLIESWSQTNLLDVGHRHTQVEDDLNVLIDRGIQSALQVTLCEDKLVQCSSEMVERGTTVIPDTQHRTSQTHTPTKERETQVECVNIKDKYTQSNKVQRSSATTQSDILPPVEIETQTDITCDEMEQQNETLEILENSKDAVLLELEKMKDSHAGLEKELASTLGEMLVIHNSYEKEKQKTVEFESELSTLIKNSSEKVEDIEQQLNDVHLECLVLKSELENEKSAKTQSEINHAKSEVIINTLQQIVDKYNKERSNYQDVKKLNVILDEDNQKLEEALEDAKLLLDEEKKSYEEVEKTLVKLETETKSVIEDLNKDLRRALLQKHHFYDLSDSDDDLDLGGPRCLKHSDSFDLNESLSETKSSVRALIEANSKLNQHLEALNNDKLNFMGKNEEISIANTNLKECIKTISVDKIFLAEQIQTLEEELSEKQSILHNSESLIKKLEKDIKERPQTTSRGTLSNLHNILHQCFMVIPSDPARDLLHMFVSQYRENLCSQCYSRITTLGSHPNTPIKPKPITKSDIMLQTDELSQSNIQQQTDGHHTSDIHQQTDFSLLKSGIDSAYSSSVSIQTEFTPEQRIEHLKEVNAKLKDELEEVKRSESEIHQALQYELRMEGELSKKLQKLASREKELQKKIEEFRTNEDLLHVAVEEGEKKRKELNEGLQVYQGLEEELEKQTTLVLKLQQKVKELSTELRQHQRHIRTSTPDNDKSPLSNESSLYLSPILDRSERPLHSTSEHRAMLIDRECDTMSPLIITWADAQTQYSPLTQVDEDYSLAELIEEIRFCKTKLCTGPVPTTSLSDLIEAHVAQLRAVEEDKCRLEHQKIAINQVKDSALLDMIAIKKELEVAKEKMQENEESRLDLEEELKRVLDYQEQEREELRSKVQDLAQHFKLELNKAKTDKKFAEETLNKSLEKICCESNNLNEQHEQAIQALKIEKDEIKRELVEQKAMSQHEKENIEKERNDIELQFFDYKIKSVSEKEALLASQSKCFDKLNKLKEELKDKCEEFERVDKAKVKCEEDLERLKKDSEEIVDVLEKELDELKSREARKDFEVESVQNKLHQLTNQQVDEQEKIIEQKKIIEALNSDVLETRAILEHMAGFEKRAAELQSILNTSQAESVELTNQVEYLEETKSNLIEEVKELKNMIECARVSLNTAQKLNTERSYKNPVIAAVAIMWHQEREEHNRLDNQINQLSNGIEKLKREKCEVEERLKRTETEAESIKNKLNIVDTERSLLKTKLGALQESKIETENDLELMKEDLNKSNTQLDVITFDRGELQHQILQHTAEKDRLLEDLNISFKEKASKQQELEQCLSTLAHTRDELCAVKEELANHRSDGEKLHSALMRARTELDNLEDNVTRLRSERDNLAKRGLSEVKEKLKVEEAKNISLHKQLSLVRDEKRRNEEEAVNNQEKLERDVAEIYDVFEEYKTKTGSAPEQIEELKNSIVLLQQTLHQIMNTNADLHKSISRLEQEKDQLSKDRDEIQHKLDNSMIDLSNESCSLSNNSRISELLAENLSLQQTINSLTLENTRSHHVLEENFKLKNKCVKYKDKLQERMDEIINLTDMDQDGLITENRRLKKQCSNFKHKLDKSREANILLMDKMRTNNTSPDRFLSSTPMTRSFRDQDLEDEITSIKCDIENLKINTSLADSSRISFAAPLETISLQEKCKTLKMELDQRNELYNVLHLSHEEQLDQSTQMARAYRKTIKTLMGYIDKSGSVKGARLAELQNQLEEQRSVAMGVAQQFGADMSQHFSETMSQQVQQEDHNSLASGSTVVELEPQDSQLI